MEKLLNVFKNYIYHGLVHLPTEEYIGIEVDYAVLYDLSKGVIKSGAGGTPIILYVINTAVKRIGNASDEDIISSMIDRGYVVIILDYKGSEQALPPAIDYSVQKIRSRIINQNEGDELSVFGEGKHIETLIVPSGYNVELSMPYWAFDKHGANGILEKIAEIWNNDFKGTNPERVIKWVDESGNKKKTVTAFDGTSPYWCDENGESDEGGSYIRLKYTYADRIEDCVRSDGSPIDLNLYMHIIYPTNPDESVPVMCLSSSAEHLINGSAAVDRPHLNGFLFRGYAGVMFDYGYTPMARTDHYGYFDGYPKKGYVTGDNATYSLSFYNDKRIFTAAMRYLRYLTLSDEKFKFNINAIGVYGNSKGAWMTFLGEKDPEKFTSKRILAGHHDETRYEAGNTETVGNIRGGEIQPWLEYRGKKIDGTANLVYSSCGGIDDAITSGHCPMFISGNRTDSSCYSTSNAMLAACRNFDIPTMYVDIPLPHTITYGTELVYGFDAYTAFFDFIGYYLKGDALKIVGIKFNGDSLPYSIKIKFSGAVCKDEIVKIKVKDECGISYCGQWQSKLGGVEWEFIPECLDYSKKYILFAPSDLCGDNGKVMGEDHIYEFTSPKTERKLMPSKAIEENTVIISADSPPSGGRSYIEVSVINGFGRLSLKNRFGKELGFVNTHGTGSYLIDITDAKDDLTSELLLSKDCDNSKKAVFKSELHKSAEGFTAGKRAICSLGNAPDGTASLVLRGFESIKDHPSEELYSYPDLGFTFNKVIGLKEITEEDMGKTYEIRFKIFDTVSRYVKIGLSHVTSMVKSIADCRRQIINVITKAGEWIEVCIRYEVYEFMYSEFQPQVKTMTVSCYDFGDKPSPIYFADFRSEEIIEPITVSELYLINEEEPKDAIPEGKSDIICKKSPWSK